MHTSFKKKKKKMDKLACLFLISSFSIYLKSKFLSAFETPLSPLPAHCQDPCSGSPMSMLHLAGEAATAVPQALPFLATTLQTPAEGARAQG